MRRLAILATLALMTAPAAALADVAPSAADQANAAKACAAERTAMGVDTFKALYGTNADRSNAFGKCVSKLARAEAQNEQNAASACTAEQNDTNFAAAHDGKTFAQFYGSGKQGKDAFGKCVSGKAKAASQAQQQATVNAAKACQAERKADPAAFKAKYGTNAAKSNAFGKCVSAKAKSK